jgi:hypothetical protein
MPTAVLSFLVMCCFEEKLIIIEEIPDFNNDYFSSVRMHVLANEIDSTNEKYGTRKRFKTFLHKQLKH